jgi:hypothetical protein
MANHPCNVYKQISSNMILQRILLPVSLYGLKLETCKYTQSNQPHISMCYHKPLIGRNIPYA